MNQFLLLVFQKIRVKALIYEFLASLSQSFADSMKDFFAKIDDLISQRISQVHVSQDNFSFSGSPPHTDPTASWHRATGSLPG